MKNTILGIVATSTLAVGAFAPIIPVDTQEKHISTPERAIEWRKHLREREEYYRANGMSQKHINQAVHSRDKLEEKMVEKKMIRRKNAPDHRVKKPKKDRRSLISIAPDLTNRALAFDWGKNDFEDCTTGTLPCNYDSNDSWGAYTMTIDTGSEVNGTDALKCAFTGEAGCYLTETTDISTSTTYYYQYTGKLESGFAFGVSGYTNTLEISDTSGTQIMHLNLEDYGSNRIILNGPGLSYTNTGLDIASGTVYKLEVKVTVSSTTGDVDIWLDNDTEGSPDHDGSGSLNTGTVDVGEVVTGNIYSPDGTNSMFWDDTIGDTSFIGAGTVPSRRIIGVK